MPVGSWHSTFLLSCGHFLIVDLVSDKRHWMTDRITTKIPAGGRSVPSIAAVIPLYNGARYIEEALRSVLSQRLKPAEIIVINDGSTDDGPAIVERMAADHPITLLHKENGGQSSARNLGIRHCGSDLIALLDQDDAWYPNHLEKLVRPFMRPGRMELGWAYSNLDEIDENGHVVRLSVLDGSHVRHPKDSLFDCLSRDMFILPSASLISRKAFLDIGAFDEALSGYEDDDLFVRLFHAGYDHRYIPAALSRWRIYSTSTSFSPRMARSRMIFARKLMRTFPDDPFNNRFYTRDLIAPRFLERVMVEARTALRRGDPEMIRTTLADMNALRERIPVRFGKDTGRREFLITAIVPLYNGGRFIRETLESVLAQTTPADEIIVVDDGSTDDGPDIVRQMAKEHPIRLLEKANGGQSAARNFGVAHAHGDLIAFLDHDDVWYPHHLATLLEPFTESRPTELGWTYSNLDRIDQDGSMQIRSFLSGLGASHPKKTLIDCLGQDMFILPSASLIDRSAFLKVGGFDESLSGFEDDDLFLRLFRAGYDNVYVDTALSRWRIFAESASYSPRMAKSRRIYAEKLLAQFPDNRKLAQFHASGVIAPRFFTAMLAEYRKALSFGAPGEADMALGDVDFIARHLRLRLRLIVLPVLPLLRVRPIARAMLGLARLMPGVARKLGGG